MRQIEDVYDLKSEYYGKHPSGHFFDHDTLRFFGETLSSMRVLKRRVEIRDSMGEAHTCYALSSLQRNHPLGPRRTYHYFDVDTLDTVIPGGV